MEILAIILIALVMLGSYEMGYQEAKKKYWKYKHGIDVQEDLYKAELTDEQYHDKFQQWRSKTENEYWSAEEEFKN